MMVANSGRCAAGSDGNPTRFPPEALADDRQALVPEPVHCLVTARAVVVARRVWLGQLAPHRGQPARGQAREGLLKMVAFQFVDRQVQQATRPGSPVQIGQHAGPVFGRDVLYRVDGQHRVEPAGIRQLLQRGALEGDGDARARARASMPADWSTPATRTPAAASIGKYLPVPHGASSTVAPGPIRRSTRATHSCCMSQGYSSSP
jgi:hypothetical protein